MMNQNQKQCAERNAQEKHERQQPGDSKFCAAVFMETYQPAEQRQNPAKHHHYDRQSTQAETGFRRIRRIVSERIHIISAPPFVPPSNHWSNRASSIARRGDTRGTPSGPASASADPPHPSSLCRASQC